MSDDPQLHIIEISAEGRAELFSAFAKAQTKMGDLYRNANNPHFNKTYADMAAVLDAALPAFNTEGLCIIQAPGFDGQTVATETVIGHTAGGYIRATLDLRPTKADPQGVGSAITYGRRYSLTALSGLAPEDDDGNAACDDGPGGQRFDRQRRNTEKPQPTLTERANAFEGALRGARTLDELNKAHDRAAGLREELQAKSPERLGKLSKLMADLSVKLPLNKQQDAAETFPQ